VNLFEILDESYMKKLQSWSYRSLKIS